jgi:putative N6-adenine-specific DNA methylase
MTQFEIFLVAPPSLETVLCQEAQEVGFSDAVVVDGGVSFLGGWPDVWRSNLCLRGATRVLARVASFRAMHLAQLDKRARKVDWATILRPDLPVRVEATCRKSKIYHAGAAQQRVETAVHETIGAPINKDAQIVVKVRIFDDLVSISIDTSGESLHKRGHKEAVNKAPMRETLAALFLRQCGYDGSEPVYDPMCGSGTFVIEAAEWAAGLYPGRSRDFAFEQLASFDPAAWAKMKTTAQITEPKHRFFGSDRDTGAIRMSTANAARAGVEEWVTFSQAAISDAKPDTKDKGLVIINPPYGGRIGDRKMLFALYGAMGQTLRENFRGWRAGIITNDAGLAKATGLTFLPALPPVSHGGIKVNLHRTGVL